MSGVGDVLEALHSPKGEIASLTGVVRFTREDDLKRKVSALASMIGVSIRRDEPVLAQAEWSFSTKRCTFQIRYTGDLPEQHWQPRPAMMRIEFEDEVESAGNVVSVIHPEEWWVIAEGRVTHSVEQVGGPLARLNLDELFDPKKVKAALNAMAFEMVGEREACARQCLAVSARRLSRSHLTYSALLGVSGVEFEALVDPEFSVLLGKRYSYNGDLFEEAAVDEIQFNPSISDERFEVAMAGLEVQEAPVTHFSLGLSAAARMVPFRLYAPETEDSPADESWQANVSPEFSQPHPSTDPARSHVMVYPRSQRLGEPTLFIMERMATGEPSYLFTERIVDGKSILVSDPGEGLTKVVGREIDGTEVHIISTKPVDELIEVATTLNRTEF